MGFGQNEQVYTIVEKHAEFPGGTAEMMKFVQNNINYPQSVKDKRLNGMVFLKFVVSESGEINNVEVLKGITGCPDCDREAIRLVKSMPIWEPAVMEGKPVSSYFNIPIAFKANK